MKGKGLSTPQGLRLFVWFSLRHLRSHWGRTLAVLIGIALGASVFTSVRLAVHATLDSFSRSMTLIVGSGDVTLVRPGGRVPETLVPKLMQHPAVQTASPVLASYVRPVNHETPFLLLGIEPVLDRGLRNWAADSTSREEAADWAAMVSQPGTMIIGSRLADLFSWQPGQIVKLVHPYQVADFEILGTLATEGLALFEGGRIALCDIATFQEFSGLFGELDRIDLELKDSPSGDPVAALQAVLPAGVVARPPSARSESGREMIRAYQLSLTFLSFISLFVGMFLIFSLVALSAAARRRELAVLRATGASKRFLFWLFISEGACIGLCGWLLAVPLSSVLVKYLLAGVSQTVSMLFVRVRVDGLALSPWEILLSFGVTMTVTILAAWQPAREAMAVPPREALDLDPTAAVRPHTVRKMAWAGLLLLALVYPVSRLPSPPAVSLPGYLAVLLLFLGFALSAPAVLRWFGRWLALRLLRPWLLRLGSQPAFLAAGYLKDSGVQTAISVGALITAVALFTALVVMIHSFRSTVELWVARSIASDLYIQTKLAGLNRFRDPLPREVVTAVEALSESATLIPVRRLELSMNGYRHLFEAISYTDYRQRSRFIWMGGNTPRIEEDLIAGKGVAVSEVFANGSGLKAGDRYRVQIGGRMLDVPILGVFRDYRTRGGAVYYSLRHFQRRFNDYSWSAVMVNFNRQGPEAGLALDRARTDLLRCCGDTIDMIAGTDLREAVLIVFDETFAITTVLLLISLVVAGLGIATTLAVLVLQRRRQINTLRALGASAAQLRRTIFWEAGLI